MSLIVTVKPVLEPLTLAEAKLHLRLVASNVAEDAWINSAISAVRKFAETELQISLMQQTLRLTLDCFEPIIDLPKGPVSSVTSVKYLDMAGVQQTLAVTEYTVDKNSIPGRLSPKFGKIWPVSLPQIAAIEIDYIVGVATPAEVDETIKSWMKLRLDSLYKNRGETAIVQGKLERLPYIDSLLDPFRVMYMPS